MQQRTITRPTNMALAMLGAAVPHLQSKGNKAVWTARRVAVNADREVGTVSEPAINASLSYRTAEDLKRRGIL